MVLTNESTEYEVAQFYIEMVDAERKYPEFVTGVIIAEEGANGYDGQVVEVVTRDEDTVYMYPLHFVTLVELLDIVAHLRPCS
jgi:hypothetical protein